MKKFLTLIVLFLVSGCIGQQVKPQKSEEYVPPAQALCDVPNKYRKSLLMIDWTQTSPPDSSLEPVVTKRYLNSLRASLRSNTIQLYTDYQTGLVGLNRAQTDFPSVADQIKAIASRSSVQYVLHGSIQMNDNAFSTLSDVANYLDFRVMGKRDRDIYMALSIYDGVTGARLANSTFRLETEVARYYQRNLADIDSARLEDVMGENIAELIVAQANFVEATMSCMPLQAQVVRKYRDTLILDVGSYHGVQVGDQFKIARRQDWGNYRQFDSGIQFSEFSLAEITQVGVDSSQAIVLEATIQDVNKNDLVVSSY